MLQAFQKILKAQATNHLSKDFNVEPRKVAHNLSKDKMFAKKLRVTSDRICLSNDNTRSD